MNVDLREGTKGEGQPTAPRQRESGVAQQELEQQLDEGLRETFPASDAVSAVQPARSPLDRTPSSRVPSSHRRKR